MEFIKIENLRFKYDITDEDSPKYGRYVIDGLSLSVNKGEFSLWNMHRYDEKVRLFEDLQAFGVTMISEGGYDDYLDCICIKYAPANEWDMYEAGEPGAEARLFFGKILEKLMPLLTACGIVYKMLQMINAPREA